MEDLEERWAAVGRAITARIDDLKLTKNEVIRASGVSYKSLTGYMEGRPVVRADKARGLCEALQWPPDAIDRLLDGKPPVDDPDPTPPPAASTGVGVGQHEISDEELEEWGFAALDGKPLTDEERRAAIAFVRTLRQGQAGN